MRAFFDRRAAVYDPVADRPYWAFSDRVLLALLRRTLLSGLGEGEGLRILDAGGGTGRWALRLLRELPRATALLADVSPGMLEVARRKAARSGARDRLSLLELDLNVSASPPPRPLRRRPLLSQRGGPRRRPGGARDGGSSASPRPEAASPSSSRTSGRRRPRACATGAPASCAASRRAPPSATATAFPKSSSSRPPSHAAAWRRPAVSTSPSAAFPSPSTPRGPARISPRSSTTPGSSGASYRWRRSSACPGRPRHAGTACWRSEGVREDSWPAFVDADQALRLAPSAGPLATLASALSNRPSGA